MERRKIIDIIVSVVAAVLLWIYVIGIVNPQISGVVRQVPVQVLGEEQLQAAGLALAKADQGVVDLDVTGTRDTIRALSAADITASVNVSRLAEGSNEAELVVRMPQGVQLSPSSVHTVNVDVEKYVTMSKPVDVQLTGAAEGQEETVIKSGFSQVNVSGAASAVEKVSVVRIMADLSSYGVEVSSELNLALHPVDEAGAPVEGVVCDQKEISITTAIYQTKTVPLSVNIQGQVWEGAQVSDTRLPAEITIKGSANMLSSISSVFTAPVSVEGLYETTSFDLEPLLPAGVYVAANSKTLRAKVEIAESGSISMKFKGSQIAFKNVPEGASVSVTDPRAVIIAAVTGPVAVLRTLAAGDVLPAVDLASKAESGELTLSLLPDHDVAGIEVHYEPETVAVRVRAE